MKSSLIAEAYFRYRSSLLVLLSVPLAVWMLRGGPALLVWEACMGIALALAGVAIRLSASRQIGRGARVHHAHATAGLVSLGPYAWTRNPLYLAAALMICGLGFVAGGGWWALLLLPATILAYTPVVVHEQSSLSTLLGMPYDTYREQTPLWIGLRSLTGTRAPADDPSPVPWQEVFTREWRLVPGITVACAGVWALRTQGFAASVPLWTLWLGASCALSIGALANVLMLERRRHVRQRLREQLAQDARLTAEGTLGEAVARPNQHSEPRP